VDMTNLPGAIREFLEATNAGDSDAFVAAFTADATLDDWGRTYTGHAGIRDWDRTDNIGVQAHFELLAIEPGEQRETYGATIRVNGNGYNGSGPMIFRLREGLIASLRIA
jgi:hypothetical protein